MTFDVNLWPTDLIINKGLTSNHQGLSTTYQVWSFWGKAYLTHKFSVGQGKRDQHTDGRTEGHVQSNMPSFFKGGGGHNKYSVSLIIEQHDTDILLGTVCRFWNTQRCWKVLDKCCQSWLNSQTFSVWTSNTFLLKHHCTSLESPGASNIIISICEEMPFSSWIKKFHTLNLMVINNKSY